MGGSTRCPSAPGPFLPASWVQRGLGGPGVLAVLVALAVPGCPARRLSHRTHHSPGRRRRLPARPATSRPSFDSSWRIGRGAYRPTRQVISGVGAPSVSYPRGWLPGDDRPGGERAVDAGPVPVGLVVPDGPVRLHVEPAGLRGQVYVDLRVGGVADDEPQGCGVTHLLG